MFRYVFLFAIIIFGNSIIVYADSKIKPEFFSTLQDIPLMSGLEELNEQAISFDKPEGHITESLALMHGLSNSQVLEFYQINLPQFGWGKVSENQFFRKKEFLEISFEEINDINNKNIIIPIVKIMIKPTL